MAAPMPASPKPRAIIIRPSELRVEYATTRLMSDITRPMNTLRKVVIRPTMSTTSSATP